MEEDRCGVKRDNNEEEDDDVNNEASGEKALVRDTILVAKNK